MSINIGRRLNASSFALAKRTDSLLTHLSRVLSTPSGTDTALCTLCYTLTLLHSQLTRLLGRQYEQLALALASKALVSLLPGETVLASIEPPKTSLSETCASVKALADVIAEFRIFVRLWGLLAIYQWARETYLKPPRDAAVKTLVWAQIGANALFQLLENGAYLASKGVLSSEAWAKGREGKWWIWSNRFWMAHILLELLRLLRVRQMQFNEDFGAQSDNVSAQGDDETTVRSEVSVKSLAGLQYPDPMVSVLSEDLEKKWHRDFYANAAWFPLALHWSMAEEDSPVSETWIGVCGTIAGGIGLKELWKATA